MFCSQCGVSARGKFCHMCGSPLEVVDAVIVLRSTDRVPPVHEWEQESRYEEIVRNEAIRQAIAYHGSKATKTLSGEAILALYDKVVASPVPLESLVAIIQPLYESWGIRTGKKRTESIDLPIGRAIAQSLCSFAKRGQAFQSAEQHDSGCVLYAVLPSSASALKGQLIVSLQRQDRGTQVVASTVIPGQAFDWGKSRRCLTQFFDDLAADLGLPQNSQPKRVA